MRSLPTAVLPVKLIFLILLSSQSFFPTSGVFSFDAVMTLTTPLGKPARAQRIPSAIVEIGVSGDGLMTKVQPAASALVILRSAMTTGKFHLPDQRLQHEW